MKLLPLLLLLALPTAVKAQFIFTTNNDGSLNIYQYTGSGGAVAIPSTTNGLMITSIGSSAFINKSSVTSVTIPNSVTNIGASAFRSCTSLTSVTIPNTVTSIGNFAFYSCTSLTNVMIGNNVTIIGGFAFQNCTKLTSITIPNSVISIGNSAFFSCTSLTSVTIGNSVTGIGGSAFESCTSLTSITIGNSVTSIGNNAFFQCSSLTDATIYSGVIGSVAFYSCTSLTSVTIGNGVTNLGGFAFQYCTKLTNVYFTSNAPIPTNDSSVFAGDNNATVYYLPGTTGWGATFDSRPTALWFIPNPLILNNGPNFGMQTNGFGFTISWATNISVVVEACTNLANPVWQPVSTNTLTGGTSHFSDPQWTNYPGHFYRLRSP